MAVWVGCLGDLGFGRARFSLDSSESFFFIWGFLLVLYTYIHTYICVYIYMYVCMYVCVCVCVYTIYYGVL